jgi:hypothetical protein
MYAAHADFDTGCSVAKKDMNFVGIPDHMQYIRYAKLVCTFTATCEINPNKRTAGPRDVTTLDMSLVEEYTVVNCEMTEPWQGATQLIKLQKLAKPGAHRTNLPRDSQMRVISTHHILGSVLVLPNFKYPTIPWNAQRTGYTSGMRRDSQAGAGDGSPLFLVHTAEWQGRKSPLAGGQEGVAR